MVKILIIADDFTGSLDTGIQFASKGIETKVIIAQDCNFDEIDESVEAIVIDTETRPLNHELAGEIVSNLVKKAIKSSIPVILKKTDSALRGNIGSELEALSEAASKPVYFIPAFPQINRITKNGIHYIGDVEISKTGFAKDPYEPVLESKISKLIKMQSNLPTFAGDKNIIPEHPIDKPGILVFDAETDNDIKIILDKIQNSLTPKLLAGCSGLASAMMNDMIPEQTDHSKWISHKGLVIIVGSVNPITKEQVQYAVSQGFSYIQLKPNEKLDSNFMDLDEGKRLIAEITKIINNNQPLIIDTNDSNHNETLDFANRKNINRAEIRSRISSNMGMLAMKLVMSGLQSNYLLTGGDTAMGFMKLVDEIQLKPIFEIDQGSVISEIKFNGHTMHMITKSGGFGEKDTFKKIYDRLNQEG